MTAVGTTGTLLLTALIALFLSPRSPRKGDHHLPNHRRSTRLARFVQLFCNGLVAALYALHVILRSILDGYATEYVIVTDIVLLYAWLLAFFYMRRLKTPASFSQGLPLSIFWLLNLASLCIEISGMDSPRWFFQLSSPLGQTELALFALRLSGVIVALTTAVVYVIINRTPRGYSPLDNFEGSTNADPKTSDAERGVASPPALPPSTTNDSSATSFNGRPVAHHSHAHTSKEAPTNQHHHSSQGHGHGHAHSASHSQAGGSVKMREGTVWQNFGQHAKTLMPFLWPSHHMLLQLRILFCICLLVCGRVVNLYVPICYKTVVDKLTPTNTSASVAFPIGAILIYALLRFLQGGGSGSSGFINNLRFQCGNTKYICMDEYIHI